MAALWSDISDSLITEMDKKLGSKYKITIRELLANPGRFSKTANIRNTVSNLKEEVDNYIDDALSTMSAEQKALDDAAMKADSLTSQLAQNVSMQAKQYKIPIVKPVMIDRDMSKDETVYINTLDSGVLALVEKLCASSVYIADYGTNFGKYRIGEWLFSGQKNYVIRAYLPPSEVLSLQASKEELDSLFTAALSFLAEV
jgi:uncharacterized protein YllA (UPF0747 family)